MKMTPKRRELIAAVRAHAVENYHRGGWDVIVECYDDERIAEVIGRARTVKGALAKFSHIIDVFADRQAEAAYQIREAVGEPEAVEHYRTGGEFSYDAPGCACGAAFATDKAADLHVAKAKQADGTYDRQAQGYHPDGSFVSWRHDEHSGDAWASRTWDGKDCRASIEIVHTADGDYETVESYRPAWKGVMLATVDFCAHSPGAHGWCDGQVHAAAHGHGECEPPF